MLGRARWLWFLAVVWLVIFLMPPLRLRLQLLWRGDPQTQYAVLPSPYPANYWPLLAKQNPQNAALQFMGIVATNDAFDYKASSADLGRIDQLIQQHPDVTWLSALRLRLTLSFFQTNRLGGELDDPNLLQHLKAGLPSPEVLPLDHRNFSNQDLAAALKICRLGEAQEPQNSYYDWMQSCLLWISWQDQSARQALHEGALKNGWNDHKNDFYTALTQGYQQVVGLPIPIQEIVTINDPFPFDIPFDDPPGQYREDTRIITWSAIKDRRAGNSARALQTLSDLHHLMYLASRGSDHKMDYLVAYGMMGIAASGAYTPSRKVLLASFTKPEISVEQSRKRDLNSFVALANSVHRPDLAHQIAVEEETRLGTFKKVRAARDQEVAENATFYRFTVATIIARGLGAILLLLLLGAIVSWVSVAAGNCYLKKSAPSLDSPQPRTAEIIHGALASGGVTAAIAVFVLEILLVMLVENIPKMDILGENIPAPNVYEVCILANVLVVILLLFLVFILIKSISLLFHHARHESTEKWGYWPILSLLLSIATMAVIAAVWPYGYFQKVLAFFVLISGPPANLGPYSRRIIIVAIPLIFGGLFFLSKTVRMQKQLKIAPALGVPKKPTFKGFAVWLGRGIFMALLLISLFLAVMTAQHLYLFLAALIIAAAVLTMCWVWFHRPYRRASLQFGLQLFSSSLQLWMCIASIGILAMLLIQLSVNKPLQQEADGKLYGDMNTFQKIVH